MDFTTKEIFKRYASILIGRPISPVFLNILVTSVCDMRCTHCFFTEELDDRPCKKLQMKPDEIDKISRTLGGNLGVLVLAGGEPFTRQLARSGNARADRGPPAGSSVAGELLRSRGVAPSRDGRPS